MPTIGKPITASARRIRYSKNTPPRIKEEPWQDRAWEVYDRLGEVFFMTRYRSGVARKVDYFVAVQERVTDDPEPVESGPAEEVFEAEGGPAMLRKIVTDLMAHWDVVGEGYLVGYDTDPAWRILSTQELKKQGKTMIQSDEDGSELGQIEEDRVFRVWRPHPRWSKQADSPTRHILEVAEELILSGRELRARSLSRLPSGVWMIPSGLDLEAFEDEDGSGLDGFATELTRKMSRVISDPGDPQALVPWVIEMDKEDIEAASKGLVSFARDFKVSMDQRKELLTRLANGLDLPAEILLGVADLNHWSAWVVTEQAVSQHAVPTIDEMLASLTSNWFHPLLEAAGVDPSNLVLWRDISPATVPPDRSQNVFAALDHNIISAQAARGYLDFNDEDAPEGPVSPGGEMPDARGEPGAGVEGMTESADDISKRVNAAGTLIRAGFVPEAALRAVGLPPIEHTGKEPITIREEAVAAALMAAGIEVVSAARLAEIDRSLLSWTLNQAESAIDKVSEKVGGRLKTHAQANGAKDLVKDIEAGRVASALGPAQVALIAQGFDLVTEADFAEFAERLEARIERSQAETSKFIEELTGQPITDWDNEAALVLIIAALVSAVEATLFRPDAAPDPADLGEALDTIVPVARIREGLDMAGGGRAVFQGTEATELIGNGAKATETLTSRGYRSLSFRWQYGDPSARSVNFEPHQRLDGVTFESWSDDVLAYSGWPTDRLRPGDHRGCLCTYVRELTVVPSLVSV